MPTLTEYIKSLSSDFPYNAINSVNLSTEIAASSISIALERIDVVGDNVSIWFKDTLSTVDEITLQTTVSNHTGIVVPETIKVQIKEENIETGGNFGCTSVRIDAAGNSTGSGVVSFPITISALSINFVSDSTQENDMLDMCIGPNTIIGYITASVSPASAWTAQEYTTGDIVTYTHPKFGARVYTCVVDTSGNQLPTNTSYWIHGFELHTSSTVSAVTCIGYYLNLFDGTNTDNLGRVLSKTSNKVYVENNISNSYSALTPTYVRQTAYSIKDYKMGKPWQHVIGESKIGGSHIPKDTIIQIDYTNNGDSANYITGAVEYLY